MIYSILIVNQKWTTSFNYEALMRTSWFDSVSWIQNDILKQISEWIAQFEHLNQISWFTAKKVLIKFTIWAKFQWVGFKMSL